MILEHREICSILSMFIIELVHEFKPLKPRYYILNKIRKTTLNIFTLVKRFRLNNKKFIFNQILQQRINNFKLKILKEESNNKKL